MLVPPIKKNILQRTFLKVTSDCNTRLHSFWLNCWLAKQHRFTIAVWNLKQMRKEKKRGSYIEFIAQCVIPGVARLYKFFSWLFLLPIKDSISLFYTASPHQAAQSSLSISSTLCPSPVARIFLFAVKQHTSRFRANFVSFGLRCCETKLVSFDLHEFHQWLGSVRASLTEFRSNEPFHLVGSFTVSKNAVMLLDSLAQRLNSRIKPQNTGR